MAANSRCASGDQRDAAGQIETTGAWDEETRELYADRIEAILRHHIQDFDAIKLARRAYSPADLAALNINLVGGTPMAVMHA